jgi:hypothetical protein
MRRKLNEFIAAPVEPQESRPRPPRELARIRELP